MKKAVLIGINKFPDGDAGAKRMLGLGSLFVLCGYEASFVGTGYVNEITRPRTLIGSRVLSVRKFKNNNFFLKILNYVSYRRRIWKLLIKEFSQFDVWCIDGTYGYCQYTRKIINFCKKNKIRLFFSLTEYFSKSEFIFKCLSLGYRRNVLFYRKLNPLDCDIIAISSYIGSIFSSQKFSSIVIPFIYDLEYFQKQEKKLDLNKTVFIYSGYPGKKDLVGAMIDAFIRIRHEIEKSKFEVHFLGFNESEARKYSPLLKKTNASDYLIFHGKVSNDEVIRFYSMSDYSILLRPRRKRYAMAGFPTKITESMALSVAPITNYTSDLGKYLNSANSIEVKGEEVDDFCCSIKTALLYKEKHISLGHKAFDTYKSFFTPEAQKESFLAFMHGPNEKK